VSLYVVCGIVTLNGNLNTDLYWWRGTAILFIEITNEMNLVSKKI